MTCKIQSLHIEDVKVIEHDIFKDDRGYFVELFNTKDFINFEIPPFFYQDNTSFSKKGVLRGLHYQIDPCPQDKLIHVLYGRVLDVAVDIRFNSSTFLQYVMVELSSENQKSLYIPRGFAHGFLAQEDSIVVYKASTPWNKEYERCIKWNDPDINIDWGDVDPILSEKDNKAPYWTSVEVF